MNIRDCWMTLLEIKERLQKFKFFTSGKESYSGDAWENHPMEEWMDSLKEDYYYPAPAWPFPKTRPGNEGDSDYES